MAPLAPGRGQAGGGALAEQVALELGQRPEQVEHQSAAGRGGVELLTEAAEADPPALQVADDVEQVAQGAPQAVELPDHQGVAGAELVEDLVSSGRAASTPLAVSTKTREHPAARKASSCRAGDWSPVETRA